jgi:hypothetical protein
MKAVRSLWLCVAVALSGPFAACVGDVVEGAPAREVDEEEFAQMGQSVTGRTCN